MVLGTVDENNMTKQEYEDFFDTIIKLLISDLRSSSHPHARHWYAFACTICA